MAALTATDIADLVAGTLRELGPMRFQNVAQDLQSYEVFPKWFKKDKVTFESGIGIQRNLMNRVNSAAARHVGLLDSDQVNLIDVLDQLQVNWVHAETHWALIYQTDILMNSGKSQIVSTIKMRRAAALLGLVAELEDRAWGSPPSSTNKKLPWGIQYWVVQNATTGFNGGAPSGHATVAGVSLTDTPKFKNYTADYDEVTKLDLIKKLRTAHRKVRFISPIQMPEYASQAKSRYRLYVNEETLSTIEDVGEGQNENLGRDVASMDGQMVFRGHPIIWIPYLDDDATDPVHLIDHATFYPVVLKGDFLRESEARQHPTQRRVFQTFVDLSYNYLCVNRRANAVVAKVS